MNALTITSCKRAEHFKKTLISFERYCIDKDLIDLIIWYDDNSTSEDRLEMLKTLLSIFKNKKIITNFFSENSFNTKKRHKEIMNLWKTDITNLSLDYVFHTEEDFEYVSEFSISEAIEFLKNKEDVAMVGFSQEKREIPKEVGEINIQGNYWEWFYVKDRPILDHLFLDTVIMRKHPDPSYWCKYINWPYFSLRPGLHDVNKLKKLEEFYDVDGSFELDFAVRYGKLYKSFCHVDEICKHIGDISAYDLNTSSR
jgi:hypothetical protein